MPERYCGLCKWYMEYGFIILVHIDTLYSRLLYYKTKRDNSEFFCV